MDSNIIQFKLDRNKQIAQALNIKHVDNFIYADDDLMRYFSFPLYECPNDMDEDEPNTLTTLNGKYCVFINDIQMGLPYWNKIEKFLISRNINCRN